ncbi:YibE/F family protein [Leucobacter komagatae]|uniref:YibE/F family protein n=1 Tax=Leucobacter komagatae TaxID=55969 RepID=UPI0014770036|nr:YibE/F family protein [Leucobacter komagatae]
MAAHNHLPDGTTFERGHIVGAPEDCTLPPNPAALADPASVEQRTTTACLFIQVELATGPDAGRIVDVLAQGPMATSGLQEGDRVELVAFPEYQPQGAQVASHEVVNNYGLSGIIRGWPLLVLAAVFVGVIVAVGRLRGALALAALGVSAGVLLAFMLPALITGRPGILVGIVGASAIMFVTLYFVHGLSYRTTSALVGTLGGVLIIAGVSILAIHITRLSGVDEEGSILLTKVSGEIDFRALLTCAIIVASLGILNDVTITQASSVWELRAAAPHLKRRDVYASAMRIGRDHIASTVYTVFFAYTGAALSVLMVMYLHNRPLQSLLTIDTLAIEIVHTLCGGIGLVLAVPITTAVAALFIPAATAEASTPAKTMHHGNEKVGDRN